MSNPPHQSESKTRNDLPTPTSAPTDTNNPPHQSQSRTINDTTRRLSTITLSDTSNGPNQSQSQPSKTMYDTIGRRQSTSGSTDTRAPAPTPISSQTTESFIDPSLYSLKTELSNFLEMEDSFGNLSSYPGAERSDYNVAFERKENMFNTSFLESLAHMIKSILGVGILSMHEAYMHGGLLTSLVATAVIASLAHYNTLMLVGIAQKAYTRMRVPKMSYPDLMEVAFATGPESLRRYKLFFRYWVDILLFVELCMTCNVYQIIMAATLKKTLEAVTISFATMNFNIRMYITIISFLLLPLCLVRNIRYLAPFSLVADFFIVVCILVALVYGFIDNKNSLSDLPGWHNIKGLFKFTGILLYTIDYMTIALPIENNMSTPKLFPLVAWISMSLVFISATSVGFFGYWKWGENCMSPIILHLPKNVGTVIMYFLFVIVLAASFALNFWVPFRLLWRYARKRIKRKRGQWEYGLRVMHLIVITAFSLVYPNFLHIIGLIGNFFVGFITFVFPPLIVTLITRKESRKNWRRLINIISVVLGVCLIGGGLYAMF